MKLRDFKKGLKNEYQKSFKSLPKKSLFKLKYAILSCDKILFYFVDLCCKLLGIMILLERKKVHYGLKKQTRAHSKT